MSIEKSIQTPKSFSTNYCLAQESCQLILDILNKIRKEIAQSLKTIESMIFSKKNKFNSISAKFKMLRGLLTRFNESLLQLGNLEEKREQNSKRQRKEIINRNLNMNIRSIMQKGFIPKNQRNIARLTRSAILQE